MMMMIDEKAEFEKWASLPMKDGDSLDLTPGVGGYFSPDTDYAWAAWQARANRAVPTDNSASLEKPEPPKCGVCGLLEGHDWHAVSNHKFAPAPSSSPLETPSQPLCAFRLSEWVVCGQPKSAALHSDTFGGPSHDFVPAESSPKSPFETQTGRIFAQLNAICFHSKMHGDCVGCLLGHAERLEIALNEQATPSPEPPRQTAEQWIAEHIPLQFQDSETTELEKGQLVQLLEAYVNDVMAPSSHSEPELVRLRRILRELVDECRSFGSPTLSLIDEVEAALASTPQNEPEKNKEA